MTPTAQHPKHTSELPQHQGLWTFGNNRVACPVKEQPNGNPGRVAASQPEERKARGGRKVDHTLTEAVSSYECS